MTIQELIIAALGLFISVIGFFGRSLFTEFKEFKEKTNDKINKVETKNEVLEQVFEYNKTSTDKQIEEMMKIVKETRNDVKETSTEVKNISIALAKKKNINE